MTTVPAQVRARFPEISSRTWEHPADRTALTAMRKLTGFDQILKTLSGLLRERQHRLLYLASSARVNDRQFADLDALLTECVEILDSPVTPELYVMQSPMVNAFCIGMDRPFIVITSALYDLMDHDELRFIVGHELGHALSGHAVYRTMLMHLSRLAASIGFIPLGGWALRALVAALMEWQRKAELSGDRAGLLCCQDLDTALRVELKLAGGRHLDQMDTQAFIAQAKEYERTGDLRDGVLKLLNLEMRSHPFSVLRAAELNRWVDRGEYGRVLAGLYPRRDDDSNARVADDAGAAAKAYRDNFDESEDPLVRSIRDGLGGFVDGVGQTAFDVAENVNRKFADWRATAKARYDEENG
ncbi:M48 family metallopeptidase [Gordonia sp. ABSL1-1]|uniref:M48 family metallopeptidase n=1 Tax=Gordonia sp. ABSL1-1 TaxID=3053923 RepID=UPI0025726844|nr:M48 family metallopeptidase [Gordonia sp. ABSL1-1]MDL9938485.1 M48 family metallopeptidase [Gordonia sp. ABSL1-1]